ncbi:ankyrin repeat domain-containing protein 50 [Microdochium nivale]|nr:ankyrin repeat domain-containing protein 50 [Microdochium nivale]
MSTKRRPSSWYDEADIRLAKRPGGRLNPIVLDPTQDPTYGPTLSHGDYTIAWICALHLELAASRLMLDEEHPSLPAYDEDDNVYVLGRIATHNVVMTALPAVYGKVNAALVATHLKRSFPNIRATLMVGVGGGAPGNADLHLGDVVVGTRVMEYDLGKAMGDGQFEITANDKHPSSLLRGAATSLRSKHGPDQWSSRAQELLQTRLSQYCRPTQPDKLFQASYAHPQDAQTCSGCDSTRLQIRRRRPTENFFVHYGGVASGDSVNKDAHKRDAVARKLDIICFEMEAAGMMDTLHCLPIRGICDYSDSHKNKEWQLYAAATAASYAKELLETIPLVAASAPSRSHTGNNTSASLEVSPEGGDSRRALLDTLEFPRINARKENIRPEQSKTCRWFLAHPKYLSWIDLTPHTGTSSLLWLRGKAGAGKSTLIKFLYLEAKRKQRHATVVSFFFNARGDTLEKSIAGMYRSILWQVLALLPDLQSVLDGSQSIGAGSELACPDLDSLKTLFTSAVSKIGSRPLFCFIDALDECNEDDARDMVEYLENLIDEAQEGGSNIRIMFSSRPYPYIHMEETCLVTLEKEAGHSQDLALYVKKCLKVPAKPRVELEERILEKASGIFMWVVLVVGILNKEATRGGLALRKRLQEIPPTLSQLFKEILTRDEEQPQELRHCILWVLCAKRPLTPGEFRHAMWSGGLATGVVDNEIPDAADDESTLALVTSTSKGLVEVASNKKKHATVQFIHESVRDFLAKDGGLQELWPDLGFDWEGTSHELLRSDCEAYLNRCEIPPSNPGLESTVATARTDALNDTSVDDSQNDLALEDSAEQPHQDTPTTESAAPRAHASLVLVEYAIQNILLHANEAAPSVSQEDFLLKFFGHYSAATLDLYQPVKKRQFGKYFATPLQMLAKLGASHLIRLHLETINSISDNDWHILYHPLMIAMTNGHKATAAALLGIPSTLYEGVELMGPEQESSNFTSFYRRSPMTFAAERGLCELMAFLARNGASFFETDANSSTPLDRAAASGQVTVLRLLIHEGLSVSSYTFFETIRLALIRGQKVVAKFLLDHVDGWKPMCKKQEREMTARLSYAQGDRNTFGKLLELGPYPNYKEAISVLTSGNRYDTQRAYPALVKACRQDRVSIDTLFVIIDALISMPIASVSQALNITIQIGNDKVAQLLRAEIESRLDETTSQPQR